MIVILRAINIIMATLVFAGCTVVYQNEWAEGLPLIIDRVDNTGTPIWTPDSKWIVQPSLRGKGDLHSIAADASKVHIVFPGVSSDRRSEYYKSPSVSPDGSRIVYATSRYHIRIDAAGTRFARESQRTFEIETANIDGSDQRRLTTELDLNLAPSWSPDGRRIVFVRYTNWLYYNRSSLALRGIYTMENDGSDVRRIDPLGEYTPSEKIAEGPVWSPDGKHLAYVIGPGLQLDGPRPELPHDLYVMRSDGSEWRKVATAPVGLMMGSPSWSPDGLYIAYGVEGTDGQDELGVYLVPLDGSEQRRLYDEGASQVVWAPDGSTLLIDGEHLVGTDGRNLRQLISPSSLHGLFVATNVGPRRAAAWSPDGSTIALFFRWRGLIPEGARLLTVTPDGMNVSVLGWFDDADAIHIVHCPESPRLSNERPIEHCTRAEVGRRWE